MRDHNLFTSVCVFFFLFGFAASEKKVAVSGGEKELELINYGEFSNNDFDYLVKNKQFMLVHSSLLTDGDKKTLLKFRENIRDQTGEPIKFVLADLDNADVEQFVVRYGIEILEPLTVMFFRRGRHVKFVHDSENEMHFPALMKWYDECQQGLTFQLDDSSFEHDTQATTGSTTGDWLVAFYYSAPITKIESELEYASISLRNRASVAYVNLTKSPRLAKRFDFAADTNSTTPSFRLFRQGQMYKYELASFEKESFVSFATTFFKNFKPVKIPREVTWFDSFVDDCVDMLKEQKVKHLNIILIGLALLGFLIVFALILKPKTVKSDFKKKD